MKNLLKLKPKNSCKSIVGNFIICKLCGNPGGTLKKDGEGLYYHIPDCPKPKEITDDGESAKNL